MRGVPRILSRAISVSTSALSHLQGQKFPFLSSSLPPVKREQGRTLVVVATSARQWEWQEPRHQSQNSSEGLWSSRGGGEEYHGSKGAREGFGGGGMGGEEEYRPRVIPWRPDLVNNIQLIGYLGSDPEFRSFNSGDCVATARIAVRRPRANASVEADWFTLQFWNKHAEYAQNELQKGMQIHVSGRVIIDRFTGEDNVERTSVKVRVRDVSLIEDGNGSGNSYGAVASDFNDSQSQFGPSDSHREFESVGRTPQSPGSSKFPSTRTSPERVQELWAEYLEDPNRFYDNRYSKTKETQPDFKHKTTGEALWLNGRSSPPPWVLEGIHAIDAKSGKAAHGAREEEWDDEGEERGGGGGRGGPITPPPKQSRLNITREFHS